MPVLQLLLGLIAGSMAARFIVERNANRFPLLSTRTLALSFIGFKKSFPTTL
jgi:hypothetical protein